MDTCENCRFFDKHPERGYSSCRRTPVFVSRHPEDWCGEYQPKSIPPSGAIDAQPMTPERLAEIKNSTFYSCQVLTKELVQEIERLQSLLRGADAVADAISKERSHLINDLIAAREWTVGEYHREQLQKHDERIKQMTPNPDS